MAKIDWTMEDEVKPADMNAIGTEINELRSEVDNIEIPPASLTVPGIVQLSNKTDGISEVLATTEKAVNDARQTAITAAATDATSKVTTHNNLTTGIHGAVSTATANRLVIRDANGRAKFAAPSATDDVALLSTVTGQVGTLTSLQTTAKTNVVAAINEVFQSGVSAKQGVVDAINAKGGSASTSDTWATLASKIEALQAVRYATGTATSSSSAMTMATATAGNINSVYINVANLGFRPNRIIIKPEVSAGTELSVYNFEMRQGVPTSAGTNFNYYTMMRGETLNPYSIRVYEYTGTGTSGTSHAYVNDTAFRVPVISANVSYTWEAFRV
ncbi:tail fiber protein [Paenibacillus sp. ACRRY]|uniref:tail fiber protein n=1 Tax=Paenibacillus sp. ACRRY TaxID=2918208 RepID=UPI001EF5BEE3|nr:tail fiber protein [Paenibacillus sp. ACRRY]MCG7385117.1 tail fiber protein [Paenibacillus sp. ACRRY]